MKKLLRADPIIFLCTLFLLFIGVFTLYSLTNTSVETRREAIQTALTGQLIYIIAGIVLASLIFSIPTHYLRIKQIIYPLFFITLALLVYTSFWGLEVRGVRRWISIGGNINQDGNVVGGLTLQTAEFAKVTVILITAFFLSQPIKKLGKQFSLLNKIKGYLSENKFHIYSILAGTGIVAFILTQKSLSVAVVTAIIFLSIFIASIENKFNFLLIVTAYIGSFVMSQNRLFPLDIVWRIVIFALPVGIYIYSAYTEKINSLTVLASIIAGIISGLVFLNIIWDLVLQPYQRERILSYLDTKASIQAEKFQQNQSIISIGAGQLLGRGISQVANDGLLLLPEPTTDFIFAIIGYKFGFVGSVIVITIYGILITRIFQMSDTMSDMFSSLILVGVGVMLLSQVFFHIGMNLGFLPVGGTTLPLMSVGGSSLVAIIMSIGLVENIIASDKIHQQFHHRKDKITIHGWND